MVSPESVIWNPANTNFDGAKFSKDRNRISYPHMDSLEAVNTSSLSVLRQKSNYLYDNGGFFGGMINTAARESGGQIPKSASGDTDWDRLADEIFIQATESAEIFDIGGEEDWFSMQEKVFVEQDKSGDGAIVLVGGNAFPQIALREGHQISNAARPDSANFDQKRWTNGLFLDRNNKVQKYRFVDGERHTDLERRDVVFYGNMERIRQRRGLPATYRMLNRMQDVNEIIKFMSVGVKSRNAVAFVWEGLTGAENVASLGDRLNEQPAAGADDVDKITKDEVMNGTKIPKLPKGGKLDFLKDDRPGPNQIEFLDYLLRDMAWGYGVPVEVVWNLAALSSANTRTVIRSYNGFIDRRRKWFRKKIGSRLRNWIIARAIQDGRLGLPQGGKWWRHNWIGGPLATADFAKDMRVMLEALNRGELSEDEFSAWRGSDRTVTDENHVRAVKERIALCEREGVPFSYAYPKASGTQWNIEEFRESLIDE